MAFNPNDHLIQLKTREGYKDYLPVQHRLVWFREQCPEGTIDTEELCVDLDREVEEEVFVWNNEKRRSEKTIKKGRGYARYRAVVTDGKGGRATGIKSENAASFPDYCEKAETGAIGRALAALGYGTQFAPELDEAHRVVDSPVDRTPSQSTVNNSPVQVDDIQDIKRAWIDACKIKPDDTEERWMKFKAFIAEVKGLADEQLSALHKRKMREYLKQQQQPRKA